MDSEELWAPIPGFPGYIVSNWGNFAHEGTQRLLTLSPTQQGLLTVGMMLDGKQVRRSAKRIVAEVWVEELGEINGNLCDTPMQLDGDPYNIRADNMVWRPRWFVWRYQFECRNRDARRWYQMGPLADRFGNQWDTIEACAQATGSLRRDILYSLENELKIWPSGEHLHWVHRGYISGR